MHKKIIFVVFAIFLLLIPFSGVFAQENKVTIYFFWGEGCPHCEKEKPFLEALKQKYPQIEVKDFEIWKSAENRNLFKESAKKLNANVSGVPFTIVGDKYFIGWLSESSTGAAIEATVIQAIQDGCIDVVGEIISPKPSDDEEGCLPEASDTPQQIKMPLLGEINIKDFSLPALTVIFGALDGFNPCAMWALLLLISLLLGMKSRKRMLALGSAFIITSGFVYFLFMAAWLNLLLFIGFVAMVRIVIGLIALIGGSYSLKEFFTQPQLVCKTSQSDKKQKIIDRMKTVVHQKSFVLAFIGIIILAFAVNLIELFCSAGLPATYVQILALNNLSGFQYYGYLLLYIFFYILDDLVVFSVAMFALKITGFTAKYTRWSHLVGGILMVILGLLLIFKPEWLMFG